MNNATKEIERRFLIDELPKNLGQYPSKEFEQGYLCTSPVVRARREGSEFVLTYKGSGFLEREEHNLPLDEDAFIHLIKKADGIIIKKTRYFIPLSDNLCIELDVFSGELSPLVVAEVEFPSLDAAKRFVPPDWFGEEVTEKRVFSNSEMSRAGLPEDYKNKRGV